MSPEKKKKKKKKVLEEIFNDDYESSQDGVSFEEEMKNEESSPVKLILSPQKEVKNSDRQKSI